MQLNRLLLAGAALIGAASAASAQVTLNEIYISTTGTDIAEFIELKGAPGTSLAGYMVLVVEVTAPPPESSTAPTTSAMPPRR